MKPLAITINAIDNILDYNCIQALNTYMDAVEQVCFIAFGIIGILWDFMGFIWNNGGKSAAVKVVAWFRNCAVPFIVEAVAKVYFMGGRVRYIWERVNSPLFIIL